MAPPSVSPKSPITVDRIPFCSIASTVLVTHLPIAPAISKISLGSPVSLDANFPIPSPIALIKLIWSLIMEKKPPKASLRFSAGFSLNFKFLESSLRRSQNLITP